MPSFRNGARAFSNLNICIAVVKEKVCRENWFVSMKYTKPLVCKNSHRFAIFILDFTVFLFPQINI